MASLTITVEVEGGKETVVVKDSAGNEKVVSGFVMFGFCPMDGQLYGFSWGSPREAAQAVVETIARSCNAGDSWMRIFYRSLLELFVRATGVIPPGAKVLDAEEVLKRWEKEDAERGSDGCKKKDPKDWN